MITYSDREYKATKNIKQGKAQLTGPLAELASWIASSWKVAVLNVIYDGSNRLHPPRIQVILEHQSEWERFWNVTYFDQEKQAAIKTKFIEIIGRESNAEFDPAGLFVVFSAFAPLAKQEADSKISKREVKALKARIGNPDLWEISRSHGCATFFFFTDAQAKRHESEGKKTEYAKRYFDLLKPHDEFGYLCEQEYAVAFDSKQNFDENFQSNWFYYDRR
jgi:hypothetical protein